MTSHAVIVQAMIVDVALPPTDPAGHVGEAVPDAVPSGETASGDDAVALRQRIATWGRERAVSAQKKANELLDRHRHRTLVDLALRVVARDRECAGTVLGSAVAFRLFLFLVPVVLFVVGLVGFLSSQFGASDVSDAGITGGLARQINTALTQPNSTRWVATTVGLFGMMTTGRTLSKVLAAAGCLAWRLPVRAKASMRTIGSVIALLIWIGAISVAINKLRQELGPSAAGVAFVTALALYVVAWVVLSMFLPRATSDPGALLPGALLVGLTVTSLQVVSQVYLPDRLSRASELYGAVGAAIVTLGWLFIMGRAIVLSFVLNAVVYERFGSISTFVFGLPVLRILPRRWAWFRRFFQLDA